MSSLVLRRRVLWVSGLSLLLVTASGCVQESASSVGTVVSYEWWVYTGTMLGGIVALPAAYAVRAWSGRLCGVLGIAGVLGLFGFGPSLFLEKSIVSSEGFQIQSGLFGTTTVEMKFADIRGIRLIVEKSRGRRGRTNTSYFMLCQRHSGEAEKVAVNNDVTEAAGVLILVEANKKGIAVSDDTGGP